jgi:hypothetical protein
LFQAALRSAVSCSFNPSNWALTLAFAVDDDDDDEEMEALLRLRGEL